MRARVAARGCEHEGHSAAGRDPQGPVDRDVGRGRARTGSSPARTSTWRRSTPAWSTRAATRPRLLAGASSSWLGPQVRGSDDLGETWQETPTAPSGSPRTPTPRVERVWQLAARRRGRRGVRRHRAGRGLALDRPGRDVRARARALGPPAPDGVGRRLRRPGLPHDPAAPDRPAIGHRRLSTGGVYQTDDGGASGSRATTGIRAEFLPEGQQYPEFGQCVHKVDPRTRPARAAVPAEPRRRLPLRRPRRVWKYIADGLPADFGFPIVVHPHEPDTVFVFPINGGGGRSRPTAKARVWRSRDAGEHLGGARRRAARRLLRRR